VSHPPPNEVTTKSPHHPPPNGVSTKPPVPLYWWPLWLFILALALFLFYVVLTPVWIAIRLVAWLSERSRPPAAA
jgi:hypothetical protein